MLGRDCTSGGPFANGWVLRLTFVQLGARTRSVPNLGRTKSEMKSRGCLTAECHGSADHGPVAQAREWDESGLRASAQGPIGIPGLSLFGGMNSLFSITGNSSPPERKRSANSAPIPSAASSF